MTRPMLKIIALGEAAVEVAGAGCSPARVQEALNLLDLVEATLAVDHEIGLDLPVTGRYQIHIGVRDTTPSGATLAEAVEAALALGVRPVEVTPVRARAWQGEHLLQLVEAYAARVAAEGWTERTDTASLNIFPPLPGEGLWEIADSAAMCLGAPIQAETLSEAVGAALEELAHG